MKKFFVLFAVLVLTMMNTVAFAFTELKQPADITSFMKLFSYRAIDFENKYEIDAFNVSDNENALSFMNAGLHEGLVPFECGYGTAYVDMSTYGIMIWEGCMIDSSVDDGKLGTMISGTWVAMSCLEYSTLTDVLTKSLPETVKDPVKSVMEIYTDSITATLFDGDNYNKVISSKE